MAAEREGKGSGLGPDKSLPTTYRLHQRQSLDRPSMSYAPIVTGTPDGGALPRSTEAALSGSGSVSLL